MMTQRKKIFIMVGLLAGLVLAVVLFLIVRAPEEPVSTPPETVVQPAPYEQRFGDGGEAIVEPVQRPGVSSSAPSVPPGDRYIEQLARFFVERVASYSNQNDNSHIEDVLPLVTPRVAAWLVGQRQEQAFVYEGTSTRVVTTKLSEKTEDTAVVEIGAQSVARGSGGETRTYRTARVELLRQGDDWKINGLFWQEQ